MTQTCPKTTQAITPVTGANYSPELKKVIWCLKNLLLIKRNV